MGGAGSWGTARCGWRAGWTAEDTEAEKVAGWEQAGLSGEQIADVKVRSRETDGAIGAAEVQVVVAGRRWGRKML